MRAFHGWKRLFKRNQILSQGYRAIQSSFRQDQHTCTSLFFIFLFYLHTCTSHFLIYQTNSLPFSLTIYSIYSLSAVNIYCFFFVSSLNYQWCIYVYNLKGNEYGATIPPVLQKKGNVDAEELAGKAYARAGELEKQVKMRNFFGGFGQLVCFIELCLMDRLRSLKVKQKSKTGGEKIQKPKLVRPRRKYGN